MRILEEGHVLTRSCLSCRLHEQGLSAIRIANKPDIVTQIPKAFFLQNVYYVLAALTTYDWVADIVIAVEELGYFLRLPSAFQHVAKEQTLIHDSRQVDYLKKMTREFCSRALVRAQRVPPLDRLLGPSLFERERSHLHKRPHE